MDKKYLKGNLNKNIAFGLAWLVWPLAVVMLILDKEVLEREEKKELITALVCSAASCIVGLVFIVNVIEAIKTFTNKETFEVPLASKLAEKFLK